MDSDNRGTPFLRVEEVADVTDHDLLTALGYEQGVYELVLLSPDDTIASWETGGQNRTSTVEDSIDALADCIESDSSIEVTYRHASYDEDVIARIQRVVEAYEQTGESNQFFNEIHHLGDRIKKAYETGEPDQFPDILRYPAEVDVDASGIRAYQDVVEVLEDAGFDVPATRYTFLGGAHGEHLEDVEKAATRAVLTFHLSDTETVPGDEVQYYNDPDDAYWVVFQEDEEEKEELLALLEQEGYNTA